MFYFVRHGEPDDRERNTGIFQGFGVHLAPLTERGTAQIKETAKDPRLLGTGLILCSPYTRAVQTAVILSRELGADIVVETELHEWLANRNYLYEEDEAAARARSIGRAMDSTRRIRSFGRRRRMSGSGRFACWRPTPPTPRSWWPAMEWQSRP